MVDRQSHLPLNLRSLGNHVSLRILRLRLKDCPYPIADIVVFNAHLVEDGHDLLIDIGFGYPASNQP